MRLVLQIGQLVVLVFAWFLGLCCPPDTAQYKTNNHLTGGSARPRRCLFCLYFLV